MEKNKYHFIGIGGIGMSALARILMQRGIKVAGSDSVSSFATEQLEQEGAEIFIGHRMEHLKDEPTVIYSTAVKPSNPEISHARDHGLVCLHRSELLAQLMEGYAGLLVAGTHGKTTTSSLLAHVLVFLNLDPGYAIGGVVCSLGNNGRHGHGDYFVAEADESDGSFLGYYPFGAIITNIDNDHLDYWKSTEDLIKGFSVFAGQVVSHNHLFWCGDDEHLKSLKLAGISYGFKEDNDLVITSYRQEGWKNIFDIRLHGLAYTDIEIPLIGGHNVLNAAAVFGMSLSLNLKEEEIRRAFLAFKGVNRRLEKKGEKRGITVYDDYGHHPTEVFATLRAVKCALSFNQHTHQRLVVAFQPHRYTRTRDCMAEFGSAFDPADVVIVTDIYAASEQPIAGVTTEALLARIKETTAVDTRYVPFDLLTSALVTLLEPGDVLVTMGAGNVTTIGPKVLQALDRFRN